MERLIQEQSFALEMEAPSKRMQRLGMEDKVVTLLNELWDKMCVNTTARRHVEFTAATTTPTLREKNPKRVAAEVVACCVISPCVVTAGALSDCSVDILKQMRMLSKNTRLRITLARLFFYSSGCSDSSVVDRILSLFNLFVSC